MIAPELAHMVKVGVCRDNLDALASITIRAARLSKMDHLIGTLEVGKAADLIVVDGSPDQDLVRARARPDDLHRRTEDARMSPLFAQLAPRITREDGAFRTRMLGLAAGRDDLIALGRGDPDFDTPRHIVEAAKAAADAGRTTIPARPACPPCARRSRTISATALASAMSRTRSW